MKNKPFLFLLILFIVTTSNAIAQQFTKAVKDYIKIDTAVVALTDVKMIDGTGGPSQLHQTMIIKNGIIANIGAVVTIAIPPNALVINCTGKTIIPGLVMMHEHLFYTVTFPGFFNVAEMPYSFPRAYLASGATTIRTTGSIEPQTDVNIKTMISQGKYIGPDIDATAPYFERAGWDIPSLNIIKDPKEAATSVNFWADKGCTSFKMYMHVTREDMKAVVTEAHKRNLKVTGHLCSVDYREAAEIGIDDLEHGFFPSSDFNENRKPDSCDFDGADSALRSQPINSAKITSLINFLISKHVALTSTLAVFEPATKESEIVLGGGKDALLPELQEVVTKRWQREQLNDSSDIVLFKKEMAWEKQFYDAGGLLLAGTDPTGSGRTLAGYGTRREVELLVQAGFTTVQAIKICTLNGAIYLGRDKNIGTVQIGKDADLVLIGGDLESDISNIRNTEIIFKKGIGFDSQKIFDSIKGKVGLY